MNALQTRNTPDTPEHLFQTTGDERISAQVRAAIADKTAEAGLFRRLSWRPALFAALFDELDSLQVNALAAVDDPIRALNIVGVRADLLPALQATIMRDPGGAEQLAELARVYPDRYAGVADLPLPEDPMRRLRVLADNRDAYHACEREILAQVESRRLESPAWAFAYLERTGVPPNRPLEAALAAVLRQDEEYAYRAMRLSRDRLADPVSWRSLEDALVSPRWAYAALRAGVLVREMVRAERTLLADPAWLVEYLVEAKADWPKVQEIYPRCRRAAAGHELIPDLDDWIEIIALVQDIRNAGAPR
jgi:hypothetical protein